MKQITLSTSEIKEQEFPKELTVQKISNTLIAQAVRVYRASLRQGNAHTKDRGEVSGSTRKLYKQKGTGRARHGSIKAPVFVGGGTVFGPRAHDFDLDMPVKMRRQATLHALNKRVGHLAGIVTDVADAKTKDVRAALKKLLENEKTTLLVLSDEALQVRKAIANLAHVKPIAVSDLNAYEVMKHAHVVVDQNAWKHLAERLVKKNNTK